MNKHNEVRVHYTTNIENDNNTKRYKQIKKSRSRVSTNDHLNDCLTNKSIDLKQLFCLHLQQQKKEKRKNH